MMIGKVTNHMKFIENLKRTIRILREKKACRQGKTHNVKNRLKLATK